MISVFDLWVFWLLTLKLKSARNVHCAFIIKCTSHIGFGLASSKPQQDFPSCHFKPCSHSRCYIGPWSRGGNYQLVSGYLCSYLPGSLQSPFSVYLPVPPEHGRIHPDVSNSSDVMWGLHVMVFLYFSTAHGLTFHQHYRKFGIGYLCSETQVPRLSWMSMFLPCKLSSWGGMWQTE